MALFGKSKQFQKKISWMEDNIKDSFSKVKDDFDSINTWLNYYSDRAKYFEDQFRNQSQFQNESARLLEKQAKSIEKNADYIGDLAEAVEKLPKEVDALKTAVKESVHKDRLIFHIENISEELKRVDAKVEKLSFLPSRISVLKEQLEGHMASPPDTGVADKKIAEIQERLRELVIKRSPKEKLIQKVSKNAHDYIKAMVISYIRKYEKISALQLREMVVEEQNITSKSTFYRILEELEEMEDISTIKEGKEKIYLAKLPKRPTA